MHAKAITINGAELHYVEQGQGEPVVFVHGGLGDWRTWRGQMAVFSENYDAISYSRRAHYPNAWPETYTRCSLYQHVADLAGLITALNLAPVHIVANSYGGYISLVLASRHPEMVRTLSLAEPPVYPLLRRIPGGEDLFQKFIRGAWLPAGRAFAEGDLEGGVRYFLEGAVGPGTFDNMPLRVRESMMKNAPEMAVSAASPFEVQMPEFTCEDAARISAPTLLMRGELSPRAYYFINDELARCIPDSEQALIPGAAHVLHSHNSGAHDRIVLDFLARHSVDGYTPRS